METTTPLTVEEVERANQYIMNLGPDKIEEKTNLLAKFREGPAVFNPLIRSLINQ